MEKKTGKQKVIEWTVVLILAITFGVLVGYFISPAHAHHGPAHPNDGVDSGIQTTAPDLPKGD